MENSFLPTLFVQRSQHLYTGNSRDRGREDGERRDQEGNRIKDHGLKGNNVDDDGASQSQVIWQVYCVLCTMNRMGVCVSMSVSVFHIESWSVT